MQPYFFYASIYYPVVSSQTLNFVMHERILLMVVPLIFEVMRAVDTYIALKVTASATEIALIAVEIPLNEASHQAIPGALVMQTRVPQICFPWGLALVVWTPYRRPRRSWSMVG
jgi:hypothetical protein